MAKETAGIVGTEPLQGYGLPAPPKRAKHVFEVPARIAKDTGIANITVVELTCEEELMATRRAGGDTIRLSFELAKECLREVNGKPMSTGDGSADAFWNASHVTKVRTLIIGAYNKINSPSVDENDAFLKSYKATT